MPFFEAICACLLISLHDMLDSISLLLITILRVLNDRSDSEGCRGWIASVINSILVHSWTCFYLKFLVQLCLRHAFTIVFINQSLNVFILILFCNIDDSFEFFMPKIVKSKNIHLKKKFTAFNDKNCIPF